MSNNYESISFEETLLFLNSYIKPISGSVFVPLDKAEGRILSDDLKCLFDIPSFSNSAMDGWALRSADIVSTGFMLTEVGSSFAGHPYTQTLHNGQCVRIMTGGKLPEGADTVVKQEIVSKKGSSIAFPGQVSPGENVRVKGSEFKEAQICLTKGTCLHAPHINFLATLGIEQLPVYRKPVIAYFSTGDELQQLGSPLKPGHIYDSNRYAIGAMIKELGFEALDLGIVQDDPVYLEEKLLLAANQADALITSGGVSVGEADFTRKIIEKNGTLVDWKCRIKPGSPLAIGKVLNCFFFGLPGNPTAAQITFYTIVKRALKLLSHQNLGDFNFTYATCASDLKKRQGCTEFQRGILSIEDGQAIVKSAGSQKTGALSSMILANCFIYLSEESGPVKSGEKVKVIPFYGIYS